MFSQTLRWNDGADTDVYWAVEIGDALTYFMWSHLPGEGRKELATQSREEFLRVGPAVSVPLAIRAQLDAMLG